MSDVEEQAPAIVCVQSNEDGTYAGWCGIEHADEAEAQAHIDGELTDPEGNLVPALGEGWEVSDTDAVAARREAEHEAELEAAREAEAAAVAAANEGAEVDPTSVEGRLRVLEAHMIGQQARQRRGRDPEPEPTDDDVPPYDQWTKDELHAEAEARELPVSGTKDELVARLEADDAEGA